MKIHLKTHNLSFKSFSFDDVQGAPNKKHFLGGFVDISAIFITAIIGQGSENFDFKKLFPVFSFHAHQFYEKLLNCWDLDQRARTQSRYYIPTNKNRLRIYQDDEWQNTKQGIFDNRKQNYRDQIIPLKYYMIHSQKHHIVFFLWRL